MSISPRSVQPTIQFLDESEEQAFSRYTGFGLAVFDELWRRFPEFRDHFRYFRDPRSNDIWSHCKFAKREFGLQLDPDIEVICLWNESGSVEIGDWGDDPILLAIKWIEETVG